jgi:hypothetical protein
MSEGVVSGDTLSIFVKSESFKGSAPPFGCLTFACNAKRCSVVVRFNQISNTLTCDPSVARRLLLR